jgi:hypothetical protein
MSAERARIAAAALATVLALPALQWTAAAHDFWLEPSSYHPAPLDEVAVTLRIGHLGTVTSLPRLPDLVERFVLVGVGRELPVEGTPGSDPAGRVVVPRPGIWWLGYQSGHSFSTLEAEPFEEYLREKGLEAIIDERSVRGERDRPGLEDYSRCAKTLLRSGVPEDGPAEREAVARPLGFTLEIVPEENPARLGSGDALPVRMLFRGAPLANARVEVSRIGLLPGETPAGGDPKPAFRTDEAGRASIPIAGEGTWLITAVHMTRAPAPERAQWESWWASLTFDLDPRGERARRGEQPPRLFRGVPFPTRPLAPGSGAR